MGDIAKNKTMLENLRELLGEMPPEEIGQLKEQFRDKTPKGWLSIEEHLPKWRGRDVMQGYSLYKVRDKDGKEWTEAVSDHNIWYYIAKEMRIVEWLNE